MGDLQCPVRVRLAPAPGADRVGVRLERRGSSPAQVLLDLEDVVDTARGELVEVVLDPGAAEIVVRRLTGAEAVLLPALLEGDSSGWRVVTSDR